MTKGMAAMLVYTAKECNYDSIVIVHQYGGCDATCKHVNWLTFKYSQKQSCYVMSKLVLTLQVLLSVFLEILVQNLP